MESRRIWTSCLHANRAQRANSAFSSATGTLYERGASRLRRPRGTGDASLHCTFLRLMGDLIVAALEETRHRHGGRGLGRQELHDHALILTPTAAGLYLMQSIPMPNQTYGTICGLLSPCPPRPIPPHLARPQHLPRGAPTCIRQPTLILTCKTAASPSSPTCAPRHASLSLFARLLSCHDSSTVIPGRWVNLHESWSHTVVMVLISGFLYCR